jgi:hypothetical protein
METEDRQTKTRWPTSSSKGQGARTAGHALMEQQLSCLLHAGKKKVYTTSWKGVHAWRCRGASTFHFGTNEAF